METLPDDTILHVLRHCAALNRIHCVRLVSMRYKELVARLGIGSLVFDDNTGPRWSTEEYEFAGQMTVGSGHNQGGNYTSGGYVRSMAALQPSEIVTRFSKYAFLCPMRLEFQNHIVSSLPATHYVKRLRQILPFFPSAGACW